MTFNLTIIVPYRDREQHIRSFIPHMGAYFSRAEPQIGGDLKILFIEQEAGKEFNRGILKNVGFDLARKHCDYVCFHDVDWLPVWSDYSMPNSFTPLVWYGAERIEATNGVTMTHDLEAVSGGAVLLKPEHVVQMNGYSNSYWGWGFEDSDLLGRSRLCGIPFERRKGSYSGLPHDHLGYQPSKPDHLGQRRLEQTSAHIRNLSIYSKRFPNDKGNHEISMMKEDGLSSLQYRIIERSILPKPPTDDRGIHFEKIKVSI